MIYQCLGFLADVREQLTRLATHGADLDEVISRLDLPRCRGWRNVGHKEWMAGNIARLYRDVAGEDQ